MLCNSGMLSKGCTEPLVAAGGCAVPVAVVMISLNEAHNMESVLQNLKGWAQEVFVIAERMASGSEADVLWVTHRETGRGGVQISVAAGVILMAPHDVRAIANLAW